ncbi:MAG: DUF2628 domain-containing protein [Rhodospirillales bacterium]|nr:DUF2628 domain-containing protein [Rhodospirillales bacterium]MBO6787608.1 DUF2628 domain-containing protein [Rhodospirillales bacterium]
MRLYSVYLRDHGRMPAEDLVLVKEGFSWPAFVFTFVWALWTRMWLPAIVMFTVIALVGFGLRELHVGEDMEGLASLLMALAIGLVGNDLRRWWLDQKGFREVAVVSGKNLEDATRRFLDAADIDRTGIYT